MTDTTKDAPEAPAGDSPFDGLKDALRGLGRSATSFGLSKVGSATDRVTDRLTGFAEGGNSDKDAGPDGLAGGAVAGGVKAATSGDNPAVGALKGALSGAAGKVKDKLTGGGGAKSPAKKFSNIIDTFDVGAPVRVAYNQWTQFGQWSEFMKKVEFAEVDADKGKVQFKAKIFVLHRRWESTIIDMVPDEQVVWQSTGDKGYLNGAVTFHEIGPRLTRLCYAIEYHPQGFWEKTINIWRSVGSRVRLETKLYIHHVMTSTLLDPDAAEGWRAEIHDKEIVRTHDEVVEQERADAEAAEQDDQDQDDQDGQDQDDEYDDQDQDQDDQDLDDEDDDDEEEDVDRDDEYDDRDDDDDEDEQDDEEDEEDEDRDDEQNEDEYEDDDDRADDEYEDEDQPEDEEESPQEGSRTRRARAGAR